MQDAGRGDEMRNITSAIGMAGFGVVGREAEGAKRRGSSPFSNDVQPAVFVVFERASGNHLRESQGSRTVAARR